MRRGAVLMGETRVVGLQGAEAAAVQVDGPVGPVAEAILAPAFGNIVRLDPAQQVVGLAEVARRARLALLGRVPLLLLLALRGRLVAFGPAP